MRDFFIYCCLRVITFPLGCLPFPILRTLAKGLGWMGYWMLPSYRKRALSNLAMAPYLNLSAKETQRLAKKSFQNLMITGLEYAKFYYCKNLDKHLICENPEEAESILRSGKGVIFFCGHHSNWEVLFLEGSKRMKGIAIGKPTKNPYLYAWILKIRSRFGGKVINPKQATKEAIRALKQGSFLGVVGDQGAPSSSYSFPFLGRKAFVSSMPARLAYKTGCPILVATTKRTKKGYLVHYSPAFWPKLHPSIEKAIPQLMDQILQEFQKKILPTLEEWLWIHNRWKQQTPKNLYKKYRQEVIAFFLPPCPKKWQELQPGIHTLKSIYAKEYLLLMVPCKSSYELTISYNEILYYEAVEELLRKDLRLKLIFNFSGYKKVKRHYLKQSAFHVLDEATLWSLAKPYLSPQPTFSEACLKALCRPHSLWEP